MNAPIVNLHGLVALKKLRSLRLANLRRLVSLEGIEGLARLEELEVQTCRGIHSIEQIAMLARLRKLHLSDDGDIESIKPVEKLTNLHSVLFDESTNILDGDLSPLLHQQHLSEISFKNRQHYSHRREDFGIAYTE